MTGRQWGARRKGKWKSDQKQMAVVVLDSPDAVNLHYPYGLHLQLRRKRSSDASCRRSRIDQRCGRSLISRNGAARRKDHHCAEKL